MKKQTLLIISILMLVASSAAFILSLLNYDNAIVDLCDAIFKFLLIIYLLFEIKSKKQNE